MSPDTTRTGIRIDGLIRISRPIPRGNAKDTNFGIKSSVLRRFLEANGIKMLKASNQNISTQELATKVTDGTLLLSCWMTYAQIEKLKMEKVLFQNLQ